MFAIIVSEKDIAGMNIKRRLLEMFAFDDKGGYYALKDNKDITLHTLKEETIYSEDLDKEIKADIFVFATRHRAKAGIKTLTVHTPGNWDKAEYGGRDKKVCIAYANLMKCSYLKLKENNDLDYEVSLECTHHGPYLDKPCMFIEIGSTEEQWKDEKAGKVLAKTIIDVLTNKISNDKAAIGLGGTHYCTNFNKILEKSDIAIGHVCPKYMLKNLDEDMLKQAIERTKEKVELFILDWKGLGTEKQRIKELLDKLKIKHIRSDKL
ncbi:D-tyrosyl-tRNA(Tyr) deacylase [Candidatus Woesearchaeota archaeon]|nr:D-tyrosyl-tRNA(Tyr) deacylase [Candidatus Woesearchaeota archaeon]